jgi:hypothetical protein
MTKTRTNQEEECKRRCFQCGRKIKTDKAAVSMEMSNCTDKFHRNGIPEDEVSQGCWVFGSDCANKIEKNDNEIDWLKHHEAEEKFGLIG